MATQAKEVGTQIRDKVFNGSEQLTKNAEEAGIIAREALEKVKSAAATGKEAFVSNLRSVLDSDMVDTARRSVVSNVRNHPVMTIAAAGLIGLIIGRLFRR